ncbi:hypothetical protein [Cryobacterium lyxosi]|uniref:Tyr recombinase domain-containing protein n=1 Tax=Cryobacterium lyxosi TaxID=1259228 RepID=A0A4R8ZET2_9MICO|nr:hypothetical protein E3T27_10025 [Cryobacterium lyxosi]
MVLPLMGLPLTVFPLTSLALTPVLPDAARRQFVSELGVRQCDTRAFPLATPIYGLVFLGNGDFLGCLAVSARADVKALQRMLGHASAKETFDTDSDLFAADVDSVAAALNQVTTKMNLAKM